MFVPRLLLSALLLVAPPASAARLSGLPSLASARDRACAALLRAVDRDRDGEVRSHQPATAATLTHHRRLAASSLRLAAACAPAPAPRH